jgi:hypothetical protein
MAQQVTAAFLAARLLTTDERTGTPTIEVSHEALIREWPRLADWLHAAREDIHLQQTLSKDVTEWEQHGKPKERLYRGSQLKEAQAWARRNTSSSSEARFLQLSAAHQRRTRVGLAAILLLLLLFVGLLVQPFVLLIAEMRFALAPTIVTSLSDTGPGSLRQAIALAPSGSTITFEASARGTLVLANALDITKSLTIHGPGAQVLSISGGNNIYRVNVHAGASVTISGLTFQNSTESSIFNEGTLTLINSVVSHNRSISGVGGGIDNHRGRLRLINSVVSHNTASGLYSSGGGIFNDEGTLMLMNSVITNNQSSGDLPGADGGGIYNSGTLTLTNSTVSGNTTSTKSNAGRGGGIANIGTLTLTNSTVSGNRASWEGGGIVTYSNSTLTLTNSTVSGNIVSGSTFSDGGGLANGPNTRVTLINSTVSGNTSSGLGGGISNWGNQVEIEFCTIYGNKASDNGGGLSIGDGQDDNGNTVPSKVNIGNSIITGNSAGTGPNISGPLISDGYNLVQDISGATFAANGQQSTDRVVKDLTQVFGANATLQDNGGPTQTLALLLGSPAIDAIPGSACRITITDLSGHTETITTDQRGHRRPDGAEEMCDSGAYESSY